MQWKPVKWCKDYEVSMSGRVFSKKSAIFIAQWLNPRRGGETDLRVTLHKNGKKKNFLVQRLVAQAFLPNPHNLPEVDHKNGITHHNHVKNLEWVTRIENERRKFARLAKATLKKR